MAAFIQKLFGRKTTNAPKPKQTPPAPAAAQQEKADRHEERLQQQQATLNGSPGADELESLAIEGMTADIRLRAAEQLTDKTALQRVQKAAKGKDKGVYQAVRQTLQAIRSEEEDRQQREEAIEALINNAADLARTEDTKLYEARLDALVKQWTALEPSASEQQAESFLGGVHQCREKLAKLHAEKAQQAQQAEQNNQRRETLDLLRQTIDELKAPSSEAEPSLASLDALQKTQENRWMEATRDTQVDKQEQKSYESLMLPLRNYVSALKRLGQNRDALKALNQKAENENSEAQPDATESPQEIVAAIDWPKDFPMPSPLKEAAQALGQKPAQPVQPASRQNNEEQQALAEKLKETLTSLEQTLEAKQLKESRQLFKTVQQQIKQLDHRHAKPYQAKVQLLGGQLRELSDWQGFATRPKQVELCEQMEYLADQPMEPEAKAERIKEIQDEWRKLGGSSERDLWNRFKQASDQAYEPCKEYFSAKSGLKQANLETRKTLVEQLQTFLDNADWQTIDWKAAEHIHQKAREEWKAAWPIDFKANRPLQKAFDTLLKQFEAPLNEERERNESLKQSIVEKAEALIEHEPLAEAMNQAKSLQGEWQGVGITRHREDRKLWQAFRKACDQIFARRDAAKNEQKALTDAADQQASALLNDVQQAQGADSDTLRTLAAQLTSASNEPLSSSVKADVRKAQADLKSAVKTRERAQTIEHWQTCVKQRLEGNLDAASLPDHWRELSKQVQGAAARELVIRAEILSETPSPDEDQSLRMEIQVQRLADGMGASGAEETTLDKLEVVIAGWCLLPGDQTVEAAQAERLAHALSAAASS